MNSLLKKGKGKKGKGKTKKIGGKKSTVSKKVETKKEETADLWGEPDEEEESKFEIEYNIKEKKVSEKDKLDTKVVESVWKEDDIVAITEKIEETKPKEKKIIWGDAVKKNTNIGGTVQGENYFPELGDEDAEKNIPDESTGIQNGTVDNEEGPRTFFNSTSNVNANLARLMVRNTSEPKAETQPTPKDDEPIEIKGKVSLKYEKTQAELMREKMMAEVAEKERKRREEREKNKSEKEKQQGRALFSSGAGLSRGNGFKRENREDNGRGNWNTGRRDERDRDQGSKAGFWNTSGVENRDRGRGGWNSGNDRRDRDRRDERRGRFDNDDDKRLADRFGNDFDDGKGRKIGNSGVSKPSGKGRSFGTGWKN